MPCWLANDHALIQAIAWRTGQRNTRSVDFPVLAVIDPGDRAQLLADLRRREFGRNEVIVHEGDPADSMHLIAKGRVLVTLMNPNAERVDVAILGPGKCFGELSMLSRPGRRTSTITAIEPTETLVLRRDQLDRLRRRYPAIDRLIAELLAEQIHRLGNELLDVLFVPARRRVIRRIVDLCTEFGDGTTPTEIPLSQKTLSGLAGTTRPTVNQVLQELMANNQIKLARGRMIVSDLDGLRRRA
jgi:CRP/FNR family cyclic AMP-dependent transcriptional regulator